MIMFIITTHYLSFAMLFMPLWGNGSDQREHDHKNGRKYVENDVKVVNQYALQIGKIPAFLSEVAMGHCHVGTKKGYAKYVTLFFVLP
jgi:hypothetical protein